MHRLVHVPPVLRAWRLAGALFLVLMLSGCARWQHSVNHLSGGNWSEALTGAKNLLHPDGGGVSSQAAEIDQRMQRTP